MASIVITGGNRGIGLELARLYAASGHHIVVGARTPSTVPRLNAEILPLNVASKSSVDEFGRLVGARPVDVLVNNAGVIGPDRQGALDTDFEGFLDILNVNTLGPLRVTQALLPNLQASKIPKVVIISSRMGSLSYAKSDQIAYRASKAAVNKVSQCLATELAAEGIAVGVIHPGWVRTDMGGPDADIDTKTSSRGIKAVIDELQLSNSGRFWNYDGSELAW